MSPILADSIDLPLVLGFGLAVLVPLMLFEVGVEALILGKFWSMSFGELWRFTFRANCWSLLAGIPTKILNGFMYAALLPSDFPGFFARYPFAMALGSLSYFLVTFLVEARCAFSWRRRNQLLLLRGEIWRGILLANVATYAVLAPVHYYATKPNCEVKEFTNDARWSAHRDTRVLFTDASTGYLQSARLFASAPETIVPFATEDYLVSADLNLCLIRDNKGTLQLYRRDRNQAVIIWQTDERFGMERVAFSPSGDYVAFASKRDRYVEVVNVQTGKRSRQSLAFESYRPDVAWSTEESKFFVRDSENSPLFVATVDAESNLRIESYQGTNTLNLLVCYCRAVGGDSRRAECGDLKIWVIPGLGSQLRIYHEGPPHVPVLNLAVTSGLLHLSVFGFQNPSFLDDCRECLFEAKDHIYLLDIERRRIGIVASGKRFLLLTPRFQKEL